MANFELAVTKTIAREGGNKVTRNSADKGGLTKYGIAQASYPQINIEKITEAQAKMIYKKDFWDKMRGDDITNQAIAESIFDFGVNAGIKTSIRLAQIALDIVPDGDFGPKTLAAINGLESANFIIKFKLAKIARYAAICQKDPTQKVFLLGWINRTLGA